MDTSQIEYAMFKKVTNGYVFRAPALRLFGPGRYYLANEAQKAQFVEVLKLKDQSRSIVMGLVFGAVIVVVVMAWAYFGYHDREPGIAGYLLMIMLLLASIFALAQVYAWVQFYRLKPVLAHLPRSEERISFSELQAAAQKSPSLKASIWNGAIQAFLFAVALFNVGLNLVPAITKGQGTLNLCIFFFVAIISGWGAFRQFRLALRKAQEIENPPET
jgi:hypothetical protein